MLLWTKYQKSITFFVIVVLCVILFTPIARANNEAVTNCRTIVNTTERLACYDAIAPAIKQAFPSTPNTTIIFY